MTPSSENVKETKAKLWVLHYRFGVAPSLWKVFSLPADASLNDAIMRSKQHCLAMNYKFVFLHPLVHDLEAQEGLKRNGGTPYEDAPFGGR